jgi:amino acid adenylation domain-containing protein
MLSEKEIYQQLVEWNNTDLNYPKEKTVVDLFEEHASKIPNEIAVTYQGQNLTYQELNQKANRLAHYLKSRYNVGPEFLIALSLKTGLEAIIAWFGIFKSGAACLPIDPDYPIERIKYMLEDGQATLLITQHKYEKLFDYYTGEIVYLDDFLLIKDNKDAELNLQTKFSKQELAQPEHLAYVSYTSGSTGRPKGAMIEHRALLATYYGYHKTYCLDVAKHHLQIKPSISFDTYIGDMAHALCSGGKLVLFPKEDLLNPEKITEILIKEEIHCVNVGPPRATLLLDYFEKNNIFLEKMHIFACGAEAWNTRDYLLFQKYFPKDAFVLNTYGTAECTIDSIAYGTEKTPIPLDTLLPIGKPCANVKVYILSAEMQLLPGGEIGELYIGGLALARGYINHPDLTKERFIENPFLTEDERASKKTQGIDTRLYRTGDMVKYLPDGNIVFLGRLDEQVKIYAERIELGEIENVIRENTMVDDIVVQMKVDKIGKFLVAYYTLKPGLSDLSPEYIRQKLATILLEVMIPRYFVRLDKFPLLPNGKLDKKSLPMPDIK